MTSELLKRNLQKKTLVWGIQNVRSDVFSGWLMTVFQGSFLTSLQVRPGDQPGYPEVIRGTSLDGASYASSIPLHSGNPLECKRVFLRNRNSTHTYPVIAG